MTMTRTTVYLQSDVKQRLGRAAARRRRSEAELIREAVDRLLAEEPPRPRPRLPLFTNVDHTLADRADEVLAEGFGADGLTQ
ncbi:MAG: ribbon-helix-helix protein, CopG family [Micromonosporaceae bacterium]|nr:ribbon-helix-helix protein, CopG family [Micromonosporaceae bacterium]